MTPSEKRIQWAHHCGYVSYHPPRPDFAIKHAAYTCGVTVARVEEVLEQYGSRMYPKGEKIEVSAPGGGVDVKGLSSALNTLV